jgi:phosphate-selective porin OprO and OprP
LEILKQENNLFKNENIMIKTNQSFLFSVLFCLIASATSWAQEDDLPDEEKNYDTENQDKVAKDDLNKIELVRIKKNYKVGDGLTFITKTGNLNITQSVQTLYNVATDVVVTENNKPDRLVPNMSEFRIRRARMKMSGNAFDKKFYYRVRLDFAANYQSPTSGDRSYNPVLQDAYVEYRPTSNQRISLGLRAEYIDTREIRFEGEVLGFVDRSPLPGAFDAIFDYGLRYSATFRVYNKQLIKPYVSITTGDGNTALVNNFGGLKYGIRLDYLPFGSFSKLGEFYMEDRARETKPKLVFGGIYSYSDDASSAKGAFGGRYIYGDANQKELFPDYIKYGVDYLFKYRGFYSIGTIVKTEAKVPSGIAGEFRLNGTFNAYTNQTPQQIENTVLSRLNLGYGYNFQAGYLLPSDLAFGLRYSHMVQDEKSANFSAYDNFYTLVTTKYFAGNSLKLQGEIGYQEYTVPALAKGSYLAQLMLTIEL